MRFALCALALMMGSQAGAVVIPCSDNSGGISTCFPFDKDPIPGFPESYFDKGGTYQITVTFDQPLALDAQIESAGELRWEAYDGDKNLIGGNTAPLEENYFSTILAAGAATTSFQYNLPSWRPAQLGSYDGAYEFIGATGAFLVRSDQAFTFSIDPVATGAVPEPANWAMLIVGFGLVGSALRPTPRRAVIGRN